MPTSDASAPQARTRRPWPLWAKLAFAAALVAVVVAADTALTWALQTYGTHFQVMWEEYRANTAAGERYDTLCIGSSVALEDLSPAPIDEVLHTTSFNISGPGETPWASLRALRIALDEHPIERVILGTSYNTLCTEPWPNNDLLYVQSETHGQPLGARLAGFAALMLSPEYAGEMDSLCFLAPFTLTHVSYSPGAVRNNVQNRLECPTAREASDRISTTSVYLGRGYRNYQGYLDRATFIYTDLAANTLQSHVLREPKWGPFRAMVDLCEERGVELIVVAMPHPDFEGVALGQTYAEQMAIVQAYVEQHGGTYLDFGMARSELWDAPDAEYIDGAHLNAEGAEHFSRVLAETIARIEAGEDVSGAFYSYDEWDAWAAQFDKPGLCWCAIEERPGALSLVCGSILGIEAPVEYEISVGSSELDSWEVVRPWSLDPEATIPVEGHGTIEIRVRARLQGDEGYSIAHVQSFTYYE